MKTKNIFTGLAALLLLGTVTSCENMFQYQSDLVMYQEDHKIDSQSDTVYSVIGAIYKMQQVADRTVLLGELKGDLSVPTLYASTDLQDLANFTVEEGNAYNKPEDYYAIVNNCNYFLANADSAYSKRNQSVFAKEIGVMKTYRAWAYLQLALNYGQVPFYTEPILTELQASKSYPMYDVKQICNYFIDEDGLVNYVDMEFPNYGSINGMNSRLFYIPVRLMLGELCLWAERYQEAAQYYHDFLTDVDDPRPTRTSKVTWLGYGGLQRVFDNYSNLFGNSSESICYIPMEETVFDGTVSQLLDIFNSTTENKYYYEVTYSKALYELSSAQSNAYIYTTSAGLRDTLYVLAEDTIFYEDDIFKYGDLRLDAVLSYRNTSSYASDAYLDRQQTISKFRTATQICLYRVGTVFLHFAEALNRAGYPESAFAVLKYGLTQNNIAKYVSAQEQSRTGNLLNFSQYLFTETNTIGMHSRGCGDANADTFYILPTPVDSLVSYEDTLNYRIPLVEDLIFDELALETCFEGQRFYDLMRYAMRRSDNDYLAKRVASRNGTASFDNALYQKLLNPLNWYLPLE